ncbi:hypothetical protein BCR32DRAFT_297836 [Anaeromyces robustus]|uniref:Carbohydrate esterase family 2 protein n=1 Tax=Anaeromyces robustus TaxID=1754192 RepID=A0A1Y1VUU8_9FUNG|nr:hypothetical protein BCR32DRAFT_297836 [Anaeromyces robustus]|eukprot:ORX65060.1 hypothetical protein BCR32DRAFT_297836 [Anaeromyces robustus]
MKFNLFFVIAISSLTAAFPYSNDDLNFVHTVFETGIEPQTETQIELPQEPPIPDLSPELSLELSQEPVQELPQELIKNDEPILYSYKPTKDNVKFIGRVSNQDGSLWAGLTDSGMEFKFIGKTVIITVSTDSIYGSLNESTPAHIFVYGDNNLYYDTITTEETMELNIVFDEVGKHTVRLIKVSECILGSIYINEIKTDAVIILPTATKDKKIEFIGDSITCAYGATDTADGEFSTKTEDGTKSYAYKVAQKFNADYSLFSLSGYGVYSGCNFGGVRDTYTIIPPLYEKLGRLNWNDNYPEETVVSMSDVDWDSSEFEPDLVVVNLGTNDAYYINSILDEETKEIEKANFSEAYKNFIYQIRSVHPNSEILCVLGAMGQDLYGEVEKAVIDYYNETNDSNVNAYKLNEQNVSKNGIGYLEHPNTLSQVDIANEIIERLETLYGWIPDSNVDISESI